MAQGKSAPRYPRGVTHMNGREVMAVIAEDTATLTENHPRHFQLGPGHMTDWELLQLHGGITQTTPQNELDSPSYDVQIRPVGRTRMTAIGSGKHGRHILLTFFQPRRSDTVAGINSATGETVYAAARSAERRSNGRIHAQDFPERNKPRVTAETDIAAVQGTLLRNLQKTTREHVPEATQTNRPKRKRVDESDVPWSAPNDPQPYALRLVRYR